MIKTGNKFVDNFSVKDAKDFAGLTVYLAKFAKERGWTGEILALSLIALANFFAGKGNDLEEIISQEGEAIERELMRRCWRERRRKRG